MKHLGDKIARIAQPIAGGIDFVFGSNIKGCSGCNKMQQDLNEGMTLTDAIYERWFKAKQQGEKTMTYQMQIVVEAGSLKEAVEKVSGGDIVAVNLKPQPQPSRSVQPPQTRPNQ